MVIQQRFASFTTDIPAFRGAWGIPFLIGPRHDSRRAHQRRARGKKKICADAVEIYMRMVKQPCKLEKQLQIRARQEPRHDRN